MASYMAEPDPESEDQALVVREPENNEQHGTVIGYCTGPGALDSAWEVAALIRQRGHQPTEAQAGRMGYTIRAGQEF